MSSIIDIYMNTYFIWKDKHNDDGPSLWQMLRYEYDILSDMNCHAYRKSNFLCLAKRKQKNSSS